ncbi:MAG TPA: serine/threonine-protein kinase [Planctomycetota bacterium]|nr:serine/threonine-protein kinase [Planctomycetota bacterium]
MAEVRCSVCGVLTSQSESSSFTLLPSLADGSALDEATAHIVCADCSSRLSAEISKGGTTVLRPPTGTSVQGRQLSSRKKNPISKSDIVCDGPDVAAAEKPAASPGDSAVAEHAKRDPSRTEFEFARKRQFGSYELLGEISRGSFGVVYKARQQGLDRIVALKVLLDGVHASPEAVERFNREAKSVARLKHPNVVPIYDIGSCDGHHYFAMAFIEGYPLSTHILARTLTISDALSIAVNIADAIECAHQAGVIHRDIKPSNILIDKLGVPHITDFGLAKQVDLENKYTLSGTTLGTPAYMPPEQARGQLDKIDARSDVYALGTVLYEMLTGVTPFSGRSLLEVVVAVINEPVPPPRQLNPKIHRDIQTIVLKCLEKERDLRYATAAELRDDLRRFRSGEAILARPAGLMRHIGQRIKRNKWFFASAAAVALGLCINMLIISDSQKREAGLKKKEDIVNLKEKELKEKEEYKYKTEWEWDAAADPKSPLEKARGAGLHLPNEVAVTAETLISPENNIFGDYRASLKFRLSAEAAAQGFTAGILGYNDADVPFVVEYNHNSARLWAPTDLYVFQNARAKNSNMPPPLRVKLEKACAPLAPGAYTLNVERTGTHLKISLAGDPVLSGSLTLPAVFGLPKAPAWGPLTFEIQDFNLSNYMMKYTRLALRRPVGLEPLAGKIEGRFGGPVGPEYSAMNNYLTGEYTGAISDYRVLIKDGEKPDFMLTAKPEDNLKLARAYFQLALCEEICISSSGSPEQRFKKMSEDVIKRYLDARTHLDELIAGKNAQIGHDADELLREIRVRLIVCYAQMKNWKPQLRWQSVNQEITKGNTKVGEALGWELLNVLDIANDQPPDEKQNFALEPSINILMRSGLDPSSQRVSDRARDFGETLLQYAKGLPADQAKVAYEELRQLFNAVPTQKLYPVFASAAQDTLPPSPLADESVRLLTFLPPDSVKNENLNAAAVKAIAQMTPLRGKFLENVQTLLTRYPTPQAFASFYNALPKEQNADFYSGAFSKIVAMTPADAATRDALRKAAYRMGRDIVDNGRFADLIALHSALRQSDTYDARLSELFDEAASQLALQTDPESEKQMLALLRYGSDHVEFTDGGLRKAASDFANRRAELGTEEGFDSILRIHDASPAAIVVPAAQKGLSKFAQDGKYKLAVSYFVQSRTKFINDGPLLLPEIVKVLENSEEGVRAERLETIWNDVRVELKKLDDDSAMRQWQLEFGDILLVLPNLWDRAKRNYQAILESQDSDPSAAARAALRLMILDIVHPDNVDDPIADAIDAPGAPADVRLAWQLLSSPSPLSLRDLPEKLKAAQSNVISEPEWILIKGLRARQDGDDAAATQYFKDALEKAQPARLWSGAIASEFLRPRRVVERESPAPLPIKPADGDALAK